jgi:CRISPR system Cascade subunit CasA
VSANSPKGSDLMHFDLTVEPWIPCETCDGALVELSLRDVLVRAHELGAIHDESPIVTAQLIRLVLAVLHRVVDGPRSIGDWAALWKGDRFDATRVRGYLDWWRHRFDLFDAQRPFLQVRGLAEALVDESGKEPKILPASRLALERSKYGGASFLFAHGEDRPLRPGEALRAMLGFLGFGPGGRILNDGGYPRACPLRAGAVILVRGTTLHRTLLLNLLVRDASERDAPAWEQDQPAERTARRSRGWLDTLTGQARRVELLPDLRGDELVVRQVITGAGVELETEADPMHALVERDPKRDPEPLKIDPDRSAWRDATALFQTGTEQGRRPEACSQIAALVDAGVLPPTELLAVDLYGLASNQANIVLWRTESVPLPLAFFAEPSRLRSLRAGLDETEATAKALGAGAWLVARQVLSPGDRDPDPQDVRRYMDELGLVARYWSELGTAFPGLVRDVAAGDASALERWRTGLRRMARRLLAETTRELGTSARFLQAGAAGARLLGIRLAKLDAHGEETEST